MTRYRTKPVVVEAEQFDGTRESAERLIFRWPDSALWLTASGGLGFGSHPVFKGDWIVRSAYDTRVVRAATFAATYEPVEEGS